jgi:hypothetical protein
MHSYARNLLVRIGIHIVTTHAYYSTHSMLTLAMQSGAFLHLVT